MITDIIMIIVVIIYICIFLYALYKIGCICDCEICDIVEDVVDNILDD